MVHGFCTEFEESMSKFVKGFGKLDQGSTSGSKPNRQAPPSAKQPPLKKQRRQQVEDLEEELLPEVESSEDSDDESSKNVVLDDDDSEDSRQVVGFTFSFEILSVSTKPKLIPFFAVNIISNLPFSFRTMFSYT